MADPNKETSEPKNNELEMNELDAVTGGTAPTPQVTLHVRKAGGEHVEFLQSTPQSPNG
jgi:hypothetical protein